MANYTERDSGNAPQKPEKKNWFNMISMTFIFYFSDQLTNVNDWLQIYFIYFRYLFPV